MVFSRIFICWIIFLFSLIIIDKCDALDIKGIKTGMTLVEANQQISPKKFVLEAANVIRKSRLSDHPQCSIYIVNFTEHYKLSATVEVKSNKIIKLWACHMFINPRNKTKLLKECEFYEDVKEKVFSKYGQPDAIDQNYEHKYIWKDSEQKLSFSYTCYAFDMELKPIKTDHSP